MTSISVAMTTYNGELYVKKQIETILNQTLAVDEIIICDDCSNDNTKAIVESFNDPRIKFISNESNLGYIKNFYKAISLTTGEYIFLADQDDEWVDNKIELMIEEMKKKQCMAMCTNCMLIDAESKLIENREDYRMNKLLLDCKSQFEKLSFNKLAFENVAQGCTYCFTSKVRDIYLECKSDALIHDHQIMLIAASIGDVWFYNKQLIKYRVHNSNAVGFKKHEHKSKMNLRKPSKKPFMVRFIDDMEKVCPVKNAWWYRLLFYLRIPYIRVLIKRRLNKK